MKERVQTVEQHAHTDPADEATVYGIVSSTGVRGILVTGFGASADMVSAEILEKLTIR